MKTISGTHIEIGRQIGTFYRDAGAIFPPVTEGGLLREQLKFYERHAPEILDEWRGIAQESGNDFDRVAHAFLVGEILFLRGRGERSCSIGGFRDANGRVWVARNYDWHPCVAQLFQTWKFSLPGRDVVAISDMGVAGVEGNDKSRQIFLYEDAINSDGLYIGMTFAHCWRDSIGLTSFDAVRLVSWRCGTVAEAINLFETLPLSAPKNFFIADSAGKMAVIQHGVDRFDVRYPDEAGLLALTNHYIGSLETEDKVRIANPHHTTFSRYDRLMADMRALRSSGNIGFGALDGLMTGPDTPVCQCLANPSDPGQVQMETVWTLLLAPEKKDYRLIGNPRSPNRIVTGFGF